MLRDDRQVALQNVKRYGLAVDPAKGDCAGGRVVESLKQVDDRCNA